MFSIFSTKATSVARVSTSALVLFVLLSLLLAHSAIAQTNSPPGSYIRSYVNDVPNEPLISVSVTGAVNVACFTIEEDLPGPVAPSDISGDGTYLPALNAIRWGPYFNTIATNVSYRITGLPASYPINGGAWMDGHGISRRASLWSQSRRPAVLAVRQSHHHKYLCRSFFLQVVRPFRWTF